MDLKRWGWKLQRRHCCWEGRISHAEGYGKYGNNEREKTWKLTVHSMKENY